MAKLHVFLHGTEILDKTLDTDKEYIVGRGPKCDIRLENTDISRQHAKLRYDGQNWVCEIMARFGSLICNGTSIQSVRLVQGLVFQIPPYEMKYEETLSDKQTASLKSEVRASISEFGAAEEDKTSGGQVQLKAVIYRLDESGEAIEEFVLGEGVIDAGRSRRCQIKIHDVKSSRVHFKLMNDGHSLVLTDLKSPNHTFVNDSPVKTQTLKPGDVIRVGQEKFRYELIHPEFENIPTVSPDAPQSETSDDSEGDEGHTRDLTEPAVLKLTPDQMPAVWEGQSPVLFSGPGAKPPGSLSLRRRKKKPTGFLFKAVSITMAATVIYLITMSDTKKSEPSRNTASETTPAQAAKNSEQQRFLEDTYNLALNLYTSGKYDLAALEISKIFQVVPNYKDARNIQALCQQALEMQKQKEETDRQKREQDAVAREVDDILDGCNKILNQKRYADVENCVNRVSDMDPDNARGQSMIALAREEMEKTEASREAKAEAWQRRTEAHNLFHRAQGELTAKRFPAAIKEFESLEKMNFKDSEGLKEKAKLGIQTAKKNILDMSNNLFKEGKTAIDAKDYKKGLPKLTEALKIRPQNMDAKILKERAESDLHIDMKNIYSESVIDENLGNIESAKKKWHQILDLDMPYDSYYEKAKMKMSKYEK